MFKWFAREAGKYVQRAREPGNLAPHTAQIFSFGSPGDLAQWNLFTDQELGGTSTAELAASPTDQGTASFSGRLSTEVGQDANPRLRRSGYCGINSQEQEYVPLDTYDHLLFRVKGDGRKYIVSLRTDNWIVGGTSHDVWQAFLPARAGVWSDVAIPLNRFLLTWRGKLVETQQELNPGRVVSVGVSIASGPGVEQVGPFSLGLGSVAAMRMEGGLEEEALPVDLNSLIQRPA